MAGPERDAGRIRHLGHGGHRIDQRLRHRAYHRGGKAEGARRSDAIVKENRPEMENRPTGRWAALRGCFPYLKKHMGDEFFKLTWDELFHVRNLFD